MTRLPGTGYRPEMVDKKGISGGAPLSTRPGGATRKSRADVNVLRVPVSPLILRKRRSSIAQRLRQMYLRSVELTPCQALHTVFRHEFGRAPSRLESLVYLHFASPIARRLALEMPEKWPALRAWDVPELRKLFAQLEAVDPETVRMMDMFVFGQSTVWGIAGLWRSARLASFETDELALLPEVQMPEDLARARRERRLSLRWVVEQLITLRREAYQTMHFTQPLS